ncbi:MAG: 2-dehydro-3-deoxyglucarate aldolase [Alphaproteobacteria bacterium]|nr:2-dehydro-3-deoxyglucarate aldolase [Alphaproteobacteria bacterium]MCB9927918.1 2-dehydro-3-deoxyglucarate aldolase [Alphaproteobacteria bacterium]
MVNRMKDKIARGEPAFGVSVMFPSPQIVEMIGHAGFDWVLLDCEHGSLGAGDLEVMAMAADAVGITPIARPRSNAAADIQAVMDRGMQGVQVPHVITRADAERAVAAVKFGSEGTRGLAAGTRPDRWGLGAKMTDFVAEANAASLVCVQIEDREALPNVGAISTVPGVDVVFVGPSDLSQSLGFPGNAKAPPVAAAIAETLAKIRAAGKAPGLPATAEAVPDAVASGCLYIYNHLPRLLGAGAAAYLAAAKGGA